ITMCGILSSLLAVLTIALKNCWILTALFVVGAIAFLFRFSEHRILTAFFVVGAIAFPHSFDQTRILTILVVSLQSLFIFPFANLWLLRSLVAHEFGPVLTPLSLPLSSLNGIST